MRKNNHHSIPTTEVKSRVKMWRSGKNWVYGLLFFFGMAGISFGQANLVHADTTALNAETEKGTIASQLTDHTVPLQTSISKSADDSTTTATSDSEPDISGTNAEQTDATVEPSTAEATGSDTTDTTVPATDFEPTTAGEQTKSATAESPVSDPVNLETSETTDTTGTTKRDDSSPTTISDTTTEAVQTNYGAASSSKKIDITSSNETTDRVTLTTDQNESSSLETPSTSESITSEDSTVQLIEDTPLPVVGYKSMLSAEQVSALNNLSNTMSGSDNAEDSATLNSTPDKPLAVTDPLPEGFTVTDPDYPKTAIYNSEDSDLYSFFEGANGDGVKVVLSTDRGTASEIYAQKVTNGALSQAVKIDSNTQYEGVSGFKIINDGSDIDILYVIPTGQTTQSKQLTIIYDIFSYREGAKGTWSGYAVLKPRIQTQVTQYLDQKGNEIAPSVVMQGLSGQNYTTGTPASLSGYTIPETSNASGYMSPFSYDGQQFNEELYKSGADWGTLTYTVKDVKAGTMEVSFSGDGLTPTILTYVPKGETKKDGDVTYTAIGNYNIPNIYIPQTDLVTYNYEAASADVTVNLVDENGDELTPADSKETKLTMLFNEETTIIPPTDIKGYTYNADYKLTLDDDPNATHNPKTYTVTDIDNPGEITLHYVADNEKVTVKYIANGQTIAPDTEITGKYNQSVTINGTDKNTNLEVPGYQATGPVTYVFTDDDDQIVEVEYAQIIKAPIHYVDNSGNAVDSSLLTNAPKELSGVKDKPITVTIPTITGYTAFSDNPKTYTISDNDKTGVKLRYVPTTVNLDYS